MSGQFTGIGAELGLKDKQIIVVAPIDGSPAQKAGIKAGDAIVKVNRTLLLDGQSARRSIRFAAPKERVYYLASCIKMKVLLKILKSFVTRSLSKV